MSEAKNFLGMTVLPMAVLGGILVATLSFRLRSLFLCAFTVLCPVTHHLDVNFVSREWYRGTTRGFEFSLLDILSISVFVSCLLRPREGHRRFYWPASFGLMLLFFFYSVFSVAISDPQLFGLFELSKMLRGMIVFLAAAFWMQTEEDLVLFIAALACAVCWQGCDALWQRYGQGYYRVFGLLGDPNSSSMYLCMLCPVLVAALNAELPKALKRLCVVALALGGVGVILTVSRTGVVTLGLVMVGTALACVSLQMSARKLATGCLAVLVAVGVVAKAWHTLSARYEEATLHQEYEGKGQGRGYYLKLARLIAEDRFLGVGLNNWSYWVSNQYGPQLGYRFVPYIGTEHWPSDKVPPGRNLDAAQAAPAHNLGALVVGELGIPGLCIFTLLWTRWFQMGASFLWPRSPDPMRRMGVGFFFGCCGIWFQSLTEWAYRQTHIYFTFHLVIGALASLYMLKKHPMEKEAMIEEEEFLAEEPRPLEQG